MKNIKRGAYNEIVMSSVAQRTRKAAANLFNDAQKSEKIDEHGNWEFGAEFDKAGRGYAINWDFYAIGKDYFSKKIMAIVQIRKWEKRSRRGFASVNKSYFLLGRNEDNTAFAHPVESRVIHHAIKVGNDPIRACQDWIFGCDYTKVIRQGDVALIPSTQRQASNAKELERKDLFIDDSESHELKADKIAQNGALYALNPSIYHLPKTHPDFQNLEGWYKVVIGKRGRYHDFAAPTIY